MKRTLLLGVVCLALLFLSAYAMAGNGEGPKSDEPAGPNPSGPVGDSPNGKGPMGGWGKFCQGVCDEGVLWQDVCKGVCLEEGCLLKKGPIPTGVWQEAFGAGGEGSAGSEISAYGKSVWSFTGAQICADCMTPVSIAGWPECYLTVYQGGTFTLNLPCVAEPLVAGGEEEGEKVTAYNYSCINRETGLASFTIYFSGLFDNPQAPVHAEEWTPSIEFFEAVGHYAGRPEDLTSEPDVAGNFEIIGMGGVLDNVTLVLKGTPVPDEPVE